ncbi:MAG: hypothetical protein ACFNW0_00550 [Fretibacterium sp.]
MENKGRRFSAFLPLPLCYTCWEGALEGHGSSKKEEEAKGLMMTTVQASIRKDLDRRMEELSTDAFYNEHNQALLLKAINNMKAGKGVTHELIDCE